MFDAEIEASQVGPEVVVEDVPVADGSFTDACRMLVARALTTLTERVRSAT